MSYAYLNSGAVGPYYEICCDLGYPQCDIVKYSDGEWAVIAYDNAPLCPSLTGFRVISSGIRNKEITHGLVSKLILESDPMRARLWEREEAKSKQIADEHEAARLHREETAGRAAEVMIRNDALMQRLAKNGIGELDMGAIASHIDPQKLAQRLIK
jgi:hypothetical protein